MRRTLPATTPDPPVRAFGRPSNANVLNFRMGIGGVLVGRRVVALLQHLFLQCSYSTVVVQNLVLWQHHGSFYGSTLAALYRAQYCCSTAPCAITAPWCYCSSERKKKSHRTKSHAGPKEKQEKKSLNSGRNGKIGETTTRSRPKASRQGPPARAHSHPPSFCIRFRLSDIEEDALHCWKRTP